MTQFTADHDGDGVASINDAFPNDPAASIDIDRDGYPDQWNLGNSVDDSTTGLRLDAFPSDAACYFATHEIGVTGLCDTRWDSDITAADYALQENENVFILDDDSPRILRWSLRENRLMNPIMIPDGAQSIEYVDADERLYIGFANGNIRYFERGNFGEEASLLRFASNSVTELREVGGLLTARINSRTLVTNHLGEEINRWDKWYHAMPNPSGQFHINDGGLQFVQPDPETGELVQLALFDERSSSQKLITSYDGKSVLVGTNGLLYGNDLELDEYLSSSTFDAAWNMQGQLTSLVRNWDWESGDFVEWRDAEARLLGSTVLSGVQPQKILGWGEVQHIVVKTNRGLAIQSVSLATDTLRQNIDAPADVDDNGLVTPLDALLVINQLSGESVNPAFFYDVNNDMEVTPLDALLVINELGNLDRTNTEGISTTAMAWNATSQGEENDTESRWEAWQFLI